MSHCLVWSVRYRAGLNEINRIKSALRSSAWLTIKRRNIPLGVKLKLILGVYAPLPVYKAVVITWNWLKSLRGEKRHGEEVIPNWQDFPKAPCE